MKTRVIQDDSDDPTTFEDRAEAPVEQERSTKLAARMARWAHHRKIVRALLPTTMKLLGDWNWYLPTWLEWLPRFEHGGSVEPPVVVKAPPALGPTG